MNKDEMMKLLVDDNYMLDIRENIVVIHRLDCSRVNEEDLILSGKFEGIKKVSRKVIYYIIGNGVFHDVMLCSSCFDQSYCATVRYNDRKNALDFLMKREKEGTLY